MSDIGKDWTDTTVVTEVGDNVMHVDVNGYEGPLDLLLDMARRQKVDLSSISVLALAEQYLAFIETIRERRIEIAADYLVMAAWLTYLKSRLMVPQTATDEEPTGEMMAAALQFRLKRLEVMREASVNLMNRPRLGADVYTRGAPKPVSVEKKQVWDVSLFELLKAYAVQRERNEPTEYVLSKRTVWTLQDARDILERLIGEGHDWTPIQQYLATYLTDSADRATVLASSFTASLELVRQGQLEVRQNEAFGPLLMRRPRPTM